MPVDDPAQAFVVGVVVAPDDVAADHLGLFLVGSVIGAVEGEVPQGRELRAEGPGPVVAGDWLIGPVRIAHHPRPFVRRLANAELLRSGDILDRHARAGLADRHEGDVIVGIGRRRPRLAREDPRDVPDPVGALPFV